MKAMHGKRVAALLLIACVLPGCGDYVKLVGSGRIVTEAPQIDGFTEIRASHSFKVTVTRGEDFKVTVRADDNVMPHVNVEKKGETLHLGMQDGTNYSLRDATMEAEVTMPAMKEIGLSGASRATVDGFTDGEDFEATLSGASALKGTLSSKRASLRISGASSVDLEGAGDMLAVDASGASSASLKNYVARRADVEASGASKVTVQAVEKLDAEASGASSVRYHGSPEIGRKGVSGSSSVKAAGA